MKLVFSDRSNCHARWLPIQKGVQFLSLWYLQTFPSVQNHHFKYLSVLRSKSNLQVWILCNDCNDTTEVFFHIIGQKCSHCESYNTRSIAPPVLPQWPICACRNHLASKIGALKACTLSLKQIGDYFVECSSILTLLLIISISLVALLFKWL